MYSPRLYKYRDSYVLYIPTVHTFGSVFLTHTLLVQTHTHNVSAPCLYYIYSNLISIYQSSSLTGQKSGLRSCDLLTIGSFVRMYVY